MIVILETIYTIKIIALVISILTGICLVLNSKSKNTQKSSHQAKTENSDTTLYKTIIALSIKYKDCLSDDKHRQFDDELTQALVNAEKKREEMTIDISNIILASLISMNRITEANAHFESMINNNITLNQLTYVLMIQLSLSLLDIGNNAQSNFSVNVNVNDLLGYCLSQLDKLNAEQNCLFIGSNDQYASLVKSYCHFNNYSIGVIYYKKIPCECTSRLACINDLLFVLYNNNQYKKILELISIDQYSFEGKDNQLILDYYLKSMIKAEKSIELIEKVFFDYQMNISQSTSDLILEYTSKYHSEQKASSFYSSQRNHSIVSYGIMMSLYAKRKDAAMTKYYFSLLFLSGIQPSIIHCQLMLKSLIQTNQITPAIELFDRMRLEWGMQYDKMCYELIIKACLDNKIEHKGYELLMQSINENIKLEKFYYEEMIDALNASELKDKSALMHYLFEVMQMSNFRRDKVLMKKLKILMEKDISVSSTDTMASAFEIRK